MAWVTWGRAVFGTTRWHCTPPDGQMPDFIMKAKWLQAAFEVNMNSLVCGANGATGFLGTEVTRRLAQHTPTHWSALHHPRSPNPLPLVWPHARHARAPTSPCSTGCYDARGCYSSDSGSFLELASTWIGGSGASGLIGIRCYEPIPPPKKGPPSSPPPLPKAALCSSGFRVSRISLSYMGG